MSYINKSVYRSRNLEILAGKPALVSRITSACGLGPVYSQAVITEAQKLMMRVGDRERYQSLEMFFAAMVDAKSGEATD